MIRWLIILLILLTAIPATAQNEALSPPEFLTRDNSVEIPICASPATCVPKADMAIFIKLLQEKKCRFDEPPTFELDPIQIITDKQGRVFFSGDEPHPYKLRMTWCSYEVEAKGKVSVIAAMRKPPIWGFRLRPKAYMGLLPTEIAYKSAESRELRDFVDAGVMIDFLYYDWINLNGAVGYRSVGGGVGVDITENFGVYSGYVITWGDWHHNLNMSLWFSFWNP